MFLNHLGTERDCCKRHLKSLRVVAVSHFCSESGLQCQHGPEVDVLIGCGIFGVAMKNGDFLAWHPFGEKHIECGLRIPEVAHSRRHYDGNASAGYFSEIGEIGDFS